MGIVNIGDLTGASGFPGTVDITVTNSLGTSAVSAADEYTVE